MGLLRPLPIFKHVLEKWHPIIYNNFCYRIVTGTSKVIATNSSEDVEEYRGELQASGYIVELDEVNVSPAKQ